jgi:prepilin-type N-terminal cleavage/methylation domain-containing protein
MIRRTTAAPRRAGFTLVELLAVIAIIAILAALSLAGVARAYAAAKRATASADIDSINVALTKFKNEYGFFPPQGAFTIPSAVTASPPYSAEQQVLKRMFPRWDIASVVPDPLTKPDNTTTYTLDQFQSLAYFLGGPNGTGWDLTKPKAPSGGNRKFFYEHPAGRAGTGGEFLDPWKSPYIYFRSQPGTGGYSGTVGGVNPYQTAGGKWINQEGVQIISAGADQVPGSGGTTWVPGGAGYDGSNPNGDGADDLANFNEGKQLGVKP